MAGNRRSAAAVKRGRLAVLGAICAASARDSAGGRVWSGAASELAGETGIATRTVLRYLHALADAGKLERVGELSWRVSVSVADAAEAAEALRLVRAAAPRKSAAPKLAVRTGRQPKRSETKTAASRSPQWSWELPLPSDLDEKLLEQQRGMFGGRIWRR